MERKIWYRGRCKNTGQWVYGYYKQKQKSDRITHIIQSQNGCSVYIVMPETVAQYIGRDDKNGKPIFEKMKVRCYDHLNDRHFEGVVGFECCSFMIQGELMGHWRWMDYEVEIIEEG